MNGGILMEKMDPVFGKVEYDYGWTKPISVSLWNKKFSISCVASAYKGQDIIDIQQKQYTHFENNLSEIEATICKAVESYYNKNVAELNVPIDVAVHVKPTELVFQREGTYGMLFNCDWDVESGIVVCLYPQVKVGPQDIFL